MAAQAGAYPRTPVAVIHMNSAFGGLVVSIIRGRTGPPVAVGGAARAVIQSLPESATLCAAAVSPRPCGFIERRIVPGASWDRTGCWRRSLFPELERA